MMFVKGAMRQSQSDCCRWKSTMSAGCFRDVLDTKTPLQAPQLNALQSKAAGFKVRGPGGLRTQLQALTQSSNPKSKH